MLKTFINTDDDMKWLFDVHIDRDKLPANFYPKSALLYGNKDLPEKIELFNAKNPFSYLKKITLTNSEYKR